MGQYTNKGLYNAYKKNNKEREEDDYYATPPAEVYNILETLNLDFSNVNDILEPCIGGGHMLNAIIKYCYENDYRKINFIGTDFKDRGYQCGIPSSDIKYGLDFLSDDYPIDSADVIIMNPPYATLEPFLIRALEIAKRYLIVLCRTQVIEGESRYEKIYKENPPTYIYQYVDRIQCWKGGVVPKGSSAQAYCWLVWDKNDTSKETKLRHIRRMDKK
jgi:hypothetical protein